jgi:fatty-acyl-CoA synthase
MFIKSLIGKIGPQRLVDLAFRVNPGSEYLVFDDLRLTRRQVRKITISLATGMQSRGVCKGDRIVSLLPACPEAVYLYYLPYFLGNVSVPLNPLLRESELSYVLGDCQPEVIVVPRKWLGKDYIQILERIFPTLSNLKLVLVVGGGDDHREPFLDFTHIQEDGPFQRVELKSDDHYSLIYTSGTSGHPKGVLHTLHQSWGVAVSPTQARLQIRAFRRVLLPFPLYHYAGFFILAVTLLSGGMVILMDRPNPRLMLEIIQKEKITQLTGSPTIFHFLLGMSDIESYDLSSVMRVAFSTEPVSLELCSQLHERFKCPLENIYGLTEARIISWTGLNDPWERSATSIGRPVPGVEVCIVDDRRHPLRSGESGEIAVHSPQMMSGYLNDSDLTAQVIDDDGWFYTGDFGWLDEDGYLHLIDRKSDMIIRAGENISPAEVEGILENHPLIRRAGVIGVPHSLSGEVVWAFVERQAGANLEARDVLAFCRGEIAPHKIPVQINFIDQIPVTATGKVQRNRLRHLSQEDST